MTSVMTSVTVNKRKVSSVTVKFSKVGIQWLKIHIFKNFVTIYETWRVIRHIY